MYIYIIGSCARQIHGKTGLLLAGIQKDISVIVTDAQNRCTTVRGKQNKSQYVEYVARKIAEIKGLTYEEVAEITLNNAKKFYGID